MTAVPWWVYLIAVVIGLIMFTLAYRMTAPEVPVTVADPHAERLGCARHGGLMFGMLFAIIGTIGLLTYLF